MASDNLTRPIRYNGRVVPGAVIDGEYGSARIRWLGGQRYELCVQAAPGTFPSITVLTREQLLALVEAGLRGTDERTD